MSTATSQAFPSRADILEPDTTWKENLYSTIEEALQPAVDDTKRRYEACLAAANTEEARTLAEEEYNQAINDIHNLGKKSFQTQIICERHERMWIMEHFGQEEQKKFAIEPDQEWKDNLSKSIKKALLPLVNDAKTEYGARSAAAGLEEGHELEKEYRRSRSRKRIRRLAKEWFEAQLQRERQERMRIMEFSKQGDQEQTRIGPDEAWKDNLTKTIAENLRPMADCARRDYKQRIAAPSTTETLELAKTDYHQKMEFIRNLTKESFQAQLDREWQERMWAFKQAEREEAIVPATRDVVATRTTTNGSLISDLVTSAPTRVDEDADGYAPGLKPRPLRHSICSKRHGAFIEPYDISAFIEDYDILAFSPPGPKAPKSLLSFLTLSAQLLDMATSDLALELAALPNNSFPIIWRGANTASRASGDPLPLIKSSFSLLEIPFVHQPLSPPADDQVPTDVEGELRLPLFDGYSSPLDDDLNQQVRRSIEWKEIPEAVEKSSQEGEASRNDEGGRNGETIRMKEDEPEATKSEEKIRYWEELGRREQELKEREEAIKQKELDFLRKEEAANRKEIEIVKRGEELLRREQGLKKGKKEAKQRGLKLTRREKALMRKEAAIGLREEAVRFREGELHEEIRGFREEREEAGQDEEESHREVARLQPARVEPRRTEEEELCHEAAYWEEKDESGRNEQSDQLAGQKGKIRRKEDLQEREEELQDITSYWNQSQAELYEPEAVDIDADERKEDEIRQQEQREQEQEFQQTYPELEAEERNPQLANTQIFVNRSSSHSCYPSSSFHSTWTISQAFAWFPSSSRASIISVQTSISSHETVSEHHDAGITDWQCRQKETYERQQEQFRREQERLESVG